MNTPRHAVLVIGVGSIGERHLRCFQTTGRAALAFVEINEALRGTIAERYSVRGYASLDEVEESYDTAVICTPANHHIEIATRLASAGKHLLIEKPLSTAVAGVDALVQTAREHGATVAVAYVMRCIPALAAMREAIRAERFGAPLELVAVAGQHFPHYRPAYRQTYYANRTTGGGAIQDSLTHILNAGEWLVGPIDRLVADAAHQALPDVTVEDTAHLIARHGRVLASYSLNQHQAPNESTITVNCERGTARYESHLQRWRWTTHPDESWHDEVFPPRPRDAMFIAQAERFLDAVDGRAPPLCTLDEGLQTLRVGLAALESIDRGAWQTIHE